MNREELKEILSGIVEKIEEDAPKLACLFNDDVPSCDTCDVTTRYAVGEEG